MGRVVFDDLSSLAHLALGALTKLLSTSPHLIYRLISIVILIAFILYQALEKERGIKKLGDLIEFTIGYIAMDILT